MATVDVIVENGHTLAAQSAPMIPSKIGLARGVEDAPHQIGKFAGGKSPAAARRFVHSHIHQLAVDGVDSIFFLAIVIADARKNGSHLVEAV